ncbi:phosphoenolpyruvate--protein phosphotransferase [Clostridium sp. C105KSO13]|uniref:phosphoenolpyruvate--protein phosphotransferase n=1 Tax=Clostridium sp. C105KSO13 TaxID=1776045 RepID=UPI00074078C0|nr:phosphoenolpyruvate--protein phosphotransferase [Clostridium sp. C105KSO13]CUX38384.1 Phosphoenolpyruvate-protein phosphotransferase [Clostridium sp. C105KSO13]
MVRKGITAFDGKVVGKALVIQEPPKVNPETKRTGTEAEVVTSVKQAIAEIAKDMEHKIARYQGLDATMKLDIVNMQKTMLTDQVFLDNIQNAVHEGYNAEASVYRCVKEQCDMLESLGDSYLAERAEDFRDVGNRLIYEILGIHSFDLSVLEQDVILVGENIPPSLLADGDEKHIKGMLMTKGSKTAHVCILAANMGIPSLVGCVDVEGLKDGENIFLDASTGSVRYGLSEQEIVEAKQDVLQYQDELRVMRNYKYKAAETKDGTRIQLLANIVDISGIQRMLEVGADGVGLFRTEFLYMNKQNLPTEMEQFSIYKSVAQKLTPMPVTIRTMDIGGDKEVESLHLAKEENPFLGYRAIRICLNQTEILREQLRAILRASVYGKIQIMFPMISCMEELDQVLQILAEVKEELKKEGVAFDQEVPTGMMVEVPSVAVMAEHFIKKVDFFSIGSNDLTQYTVAVDRQNEKISGLYDYFHPAVLSLIQNTIQACHKTKKPCSLCGEMAADIQAIPLLLGMGLRKYSVNPSSVLKVKKILANCSEKQAEKLASTACEAYSATAVRKLINEMSGDE